MDFGLSEEQELLQETVHGFVRGECPVTRLREVYDAGGFDPALWKGLAALGCAGLALAFVHALAARWQDRPLIAAPASAHSE